MEMVHDQEGHSDLDNAIPNQPVQVQSVIQSNQHSVIQATGQVEDESEGADGRTRREILARRPSYRKILNDLSSDGPSIPGVSKIDEESNHSSPESQESESQSQTATSQYQEYVSVVPAGAIQIAAHGDNSAQGLQTLTMTNASGGSSGATIVQYAQGPDGQFFIPATAVSGGGVQAYQITSAANLPQGVQGVVMASAGALSSHGQIGQMGEEASRKRELRLLKNREAAKECRRKKKEYVKCLENRVAVLENQNKALIEELKSLKELYCQKENVGP